MSNVLIWVRAQPDKLSKLPLRQTQRITLVAPLNYLVFPSQCCWNLYVESENLGSWHSWCSILAAFTSNWSTDSTQLFPWVWTEKILETLPAVLWSSSDCLDEVKVMGPLKTVLLNPFWLFGMVVEFLLETPASHVGVPGFESCLLHSQPT